VIYMQNPDLKDIPTTVKAEPRDYFDPMTQNYTTFGRDYDPFVAVDKGILELVDQLIEEKIEGFLKEKSAPFEFKKIDDNLAEREIECFLLEMREKDVSKTSIFDIVVSLRLPAEQVERIMEKFEKEGRVSGLNE